MNDLDRTRPHSAWRAALLATCMAVALAACGGGGSSDDDPEPEPPTGSTIPPAADPVAVPDPETSSGVVGEVHWPDGSTGTATTKAPIEGQACINLPGVVHQHASAHLSVFLDGTRLALPKGIGDIDPEPDRCLYSLHTHSGNGMIHIEADVERERTLGEFFEIWGEALTSTDVAGLTGDPIRFYVRDDGGEITEVDAAEAAAIVVQDKREITIQVGTPPAEIPTFTW